MDERILKVILCSCESITKDLEQSEDYQKLCQEEKFLPKSDTIFNALSSSLTKLLCYKVSKQAYQRYTVRLHTIDVLREWCRIPDGFDDIRAFKDGKQTLKLVKNLLERHLTDDLLDKCNNDDNLLPLISSLMTLSFRKTYCNNHIQRLLIKLTKLESSDTCQELLCYAVHNNSIFNLDLSTIEEIYKSQRHKLIEQPLLDAFVPTCSNLNKNDNVDNFESIHLTDELIKFSSKSSQIFQTVCAVLKEILVQLDYAPAAMNFIQSCLNKISKHCESEEKSILDLYPRNLQSSVILLQIEPSFHTVDSKEATLKALENILLENKNAAINLLSHFPTWLKIFGEYLKKNSDTFV